MEITIKKNYQRGNIKSTNIDKQNSILIKSKEILDRAANGGYEYKIDGLIYLPASLPVKSDFDKKIKNSINGTWCSCPEILNGFTTSRFIAKWEYNTYLRKI